MDDDFKNVNIYDLLEISSEADIKTIKTAYRKKALKCHPDKNPNNPNAAKLFDELKKVLDVLTDDKKRATYDQNLKRKEAVRLRDEKRDSECKRFKKDLERREKEADLQRHHSDKEKDKIERLRRDAAVELDKYAQKYREANVQRQKDVFASYGGMNMRWKTDKKDINSDSYNRNGSAKMSSKDNCDLDSFEESVLRAMKEAQAKKNKSASGESTFSNTSSIKE